MNYRHAFHAGNFADLVKHALLLDLLDRMAKGPPLTVIDTHAGRGLYDLQGAEAKKSGEAEAGIVRLMAAKDAPADFELLRRAVRKLNGGAASRCYPGSPWLIAEALRPKDTYIACELRADEHAALRQALKGHPKVQTLCADGYEVAQARAPTGGALLLVIDPPFERADDYDRTVRAVAAVHERNPGAVMLIWLPLKDLATFDSFLADLEDAVGAPTLVAETRVRPLSDPMKMNGCALVVVNPPPGLESPAEAVCRWTAETLGQGGEARVYAL